MTNIEPLEISPEFKAFIDWFTELQEWSKKERDKMFWITKDQLGESTERINHSQTQTIPVED